MQGLGAAENAEAMHMHACMHGASPLVFSWPYLIGDTLGLEDYALDWMDINPVINWLPVMWVRYEQGKGYSSFTIYCAEISQHCDFGTKDRSRFHFVCTGCISGA